MQTNGLSVSWVILFVLITVIYLVAGLLLLSFSNLSDQGRFVAKLIPTLIVIASIWKAKELRGVLFNSQFLSGMMLIITILLIVWSVNQMAVFQKSTIDVIVFHLSRNILTSIFEEGLFRVILFVGLIQFFRNSSLRFWKATLVTSLVFGAVHFTNIIRPDFGLYAALRQVIFAFGIGFFLQVVYMVSRNILVPICIHFLVNFFGTSGQLNSTQSIVAKGENQDLSSLLLLFVFFAFLVGLSSLIYRKRAFERYIRSME